MAVAGLYVYPVKSCRGVALARAVVTPQGLGIPAPGGGAVAIDRQWCVCGDDGLVQDIRVHPRLATVEVAIDGAGTAGAAVVLRTTGGGPELRLPVAEGAYRRNPRVAVSDRYRNKWFGHALDGWCAGPEAADWVTRFLVENSSLARASGMRFRIVRFASSEAPRRVNTAFGGKSVIARRAAAGDTAGFADCGAYHLLSEASLADLTARLPAGSGVERPVSFARFRPNVVVRGVAAYAEDGFGACAVGGATFRQLGPTGRCVIPTTDPATGARDAAAEPRATLLKYRPLPYGDGPHGGPTLGVWLAPDAGAAGAEVRVGDPVRPAAARL